MRLWAYFCMSRGLQGLGGLRCAYGHNMNFQALRETLRQARHQAPTDRKGVRRVGMTLKEAAAASGVNLSTIHAIENVTREPGLKPDLETVERLALAYGLKLWTVIRQAESAQPTPDLSSPNSIGPDFAGAPDDEPQFESEERIQQAVFRTLARFAAAGIKEDAPARPTDYRLPPAARPIAAESSRHARSARPRDVPTPKKERQKKPPRK